MPKVIYDTDIFGEKVKLYDYSETPCCEICNYHWRGSTFDKKGPRKAGLITDVDAAIQNKQRHSVGHLRKITVDKTLMAKMQHPRPPELKPNQVYACECCYDVYISTKRLMSEEPTTLPEYKKA